MLTKRDLLRSAALAAITASTAKSVSVHAQTSADRASAWPGQDGLTAALHASACSLHISATFRPLGGRLSGRSPVN